MVGQNCETEVFGLSKNADDLDHSILHNLMEYNFVDKNEVGFWYGIYLYYFSLLEKWVIFTLFL